MAPINESWMDISQKELGLITTVSDNLKLMETADGFSEIENLNAESEEKQRQLELIRENGLEMNRQLQAFREEEKSIANKLIEIITLSNSIDSSLKSEEEILKIRMEQHKSLMGKLQDARLKSETAKKEFECARQELYTLCPDLANKID
ncbi:hypothetical protein SUGI_0179710 [Cryptomeria japonica]|nr:hypothetical protein SUGI_0179710 [Cryptomeria japonica]